MARAYELLKCPKTDCRMNHGFKTDLRRTFHICSHIIKTLLICNAIYIHVPTHILNILRAFCLLWPTTFLDSQLTTSQRRHRPAQGKLSDSILTHLSSAPRIKYVTRSPCSHHGMSMYTACGSNPGQGMGAHPKEVPFRPNLNIQPIKNQMALRIFWLGIKRSRFNLI